MKCWTLSIYFFGFFVLFFSLWSLNIVNLLINKQTKKKEDKQQKPNYFYFVSYFQHKMKKNVVSFEFHKCYLFMMQNRLSFNFSYIGTPNRMISSICMIMQKVFSETQTKVSYKPNMLNKIVLFKNYYL